MVEKVDINVYSDSEVVEYFDFFQEKQTTPKYDCVGEKNPQL